MCHAFFLLTNKPLSGACHDLRKHNIDQTVPEVQGECIKNCAFGKRSALDSLSCNLDQGWANIGLKFHCTQIGRKIME